MTEREAFEAQAELHGLETFLMGETQVYAAQPTRVAWLLWQASRKQALEEEKPARLKAWETAWDACRKQTISECEAAAREFLARCGTHLFPDDIEYVADAIRSISHPTGGKE